MDRKKFGIFYTPSDATRILCRWAIRSSEDKILEPSFGGCGFLEASRDRLTELKNSDPCTQLFGCDVDGEAFSKFLVPKFNRADLSERFKHKDFLSVFPRDFSPDGFDVVVGNPPYISHHDMSVAQKESAAIAMLGAGYSLSSKASLWAYFIFHSFSFLKQGGRIAWILPGSFLHAEYSSAIRDIISKKFSRSLVIQLGQRLFSSEGTEESTAVLLAEGWNVGATKDALKVNFARDLTQLEEIIFSNGNRTWGGRNYDKRIGVALMSKQASDCLKLIDDVEDTRPLGDIADILIGIVTGASDFFIINRDTAQSWQLPETALKPILSKFKLAQGINLQKSDLKKRASDNFRCLLVDTNELQDEDLALRVYLWSFPEEEKHKTKTFDNRNVWHQPDDGRVPGAFFPYMLQNGPRLVINQAKTTCTNTIHRVFFKSEVTTLQKKIAAISVLSTYSQLSAEIEGRSYGSGALKHEPSEAKRIKLILPKDASNENVERTFREIDGLLRVGKIEQAKHIADQFVMGDLIRKRGDKVISVLRQALHLARSRRHNSKSKHNSISNGTNKA